MLTEGNQDRPVGHLLHRAAIVYRQAITRRLRDQQWLVDVGFRPPAIGGLMTIAAREPVSQRQLSDEMGVDPSDVVAVVDLLERANFVSRERDPDDRRRVALMLTPAGRKAVKRLRSVLEGIEDEVLAPLSTSDRETLRGLLTQIITYHLDGEEPGATDQAADQARSSVPAGSRSS